MVVLEGLVKMAKVLLFTSSAHLKYKERKPDNRNASRRSCHLAAASLAVGANPLLADDEGRCPLHIAAWQGHAELVYLLLQVSPSRVIFNWSGMELCCSVGTNITKLHHVKTMDYNIVFMIPHSR